MKEQTHEAMVALVEALWKDKEGSNELHVFSNLPMQLHKAVLHFHNKYDKTNL